MFETILTSISALRPFAWRTALAILIMCSTLIFLPDTVIEKLGLTELLSASRSAISIALIFSGSIILVEIFDALRGIIVERHKTNKYRTNMFKHLSELTKDEKLALKEYADGDLGTVHFSMSGGVAGFLEAKGIISRSSNLGIPGTSDTFAYSIQPVAMKLLRENPDLLQN